MMPPRESRGLDWTVGQGRRSLQAPNQGRVPFVQTGGTVPSLANPVRINTPHHGQVFGAIPIPTSSNSKHDNGQPCSIFGIPLGLLRVSFLPLGPSATQCPFWTSQDPWTRWRHRLLLGGFVGMRGADTGVPIADYTSLIHTQR